MSGALTLWSDLRVWHYGGEDGAAHECDEIETIAALTEYRDTGAMWLRVLADPSECTNSEELSNTGPDASDIDWTGLPLTLEAVTELLTDWEPQPRDLDPSELCLRVDADSYDANDGSLGPADVRARLQGTGWSARWAGDGNTNADGASTEDVIVSLDGGLSHGK
jgi:hypothetical protein